MNTRGKWEVPKLPPREPTSITGVRSFIPAYDRYDVCSDPVTTRTVISQDNWKLTCHPQPDEPFIDITVQVADGLGIRGNRLDERELLTDQSWQIVQVMKKF